MSGRTSAKTQSSDPSPGPVLRADLPEDLKKGLNMVPSESASAVGGGGGVQKDFIVDDSTYVTFLKRDYAGGRSEVGVAIKGTQESSSG